MANYIYGAVSLTGGGTGSLDSLDGTELGQHDAAIVFTPTATYIYTLDESYGGSENIPELIVPDQNPGNKRWVLISSRAAESSCDYSAFNGILNSSHNDVQKALSAIDDMFDTGDFVIAPGSVELSPTVVKLVGSNSGSATPVDHIFRVTGDGKLRTTASGNTVTVHSDDLKIVTKYINYTITKDDDIVVGDCSGGSIELTLPQASTKSSISIFKLSSDNSLTIRCYGSETIEGAASYVINDEYGTLRLISNGVNTWITSAQMYDLPIASDTVVGAIKIGDNLSMNSGVLSPDFSAINTDLVPDTDVTRSLGSPTKQWKDVYVGPGSLYVNGQKVLEDAGGTIVLGADDDQNIQIKTGGGGDIEFYPSGAGSIEMKGTLSIQGGKNIVSSDGNPINFANHIQMNGLRITGLGDPVNPGDVATKSFASNASNLVGTLPAGTLPDNYLKIDSNFSDLANITTAKTNLGLNNVVNVDTTNASNITTGTLPSSVLPPIAITTTQVAANQTAMLALTTQQGDVVVRTDLNRSYIHNGGSVGTMADFTELSTPVDSVLSVNTKTGTVVLSQDDVADGATYKRSTASFTTALNTKLNGIAAGAQVNPTAAAIKTSYESNANTNAFTDTLLTKLNSIESSATADQTASEIKTAYESNADTNAFTDSLQTKLNGINTSLYAVKSNNLSDLTSASSARTNLGLGNVANVDTTNASNITTGTLPSNVLPSIALTTTQVASSEVAMLALTTDEGDVVVRTDLNRSYIRTSGTTGTISDFIELSSSGDTVTSVNTKTGTVVLTQDDIGDGTTYKRSTASFTTALNTKLNGIETAATADQTASEIKDLYESNSDTNAFTNDFKTKVEGIEPGATADQTALEIKTAYESNENTNALTNTLLSKLNGIETAATADQTAAEIKTAYESNSNTNAFTDTLQTKLNGIDTSLYATKANNLSDLSNATTARTNLGLGNVANVDCTNASNITTGTLPSSVLPPIAITKTQVAASQVAMLALTTEEGDVVVRTDESKTYIKGSGTAGTMADFIEIMTPGDVTSVNSQTGTVVLTQDNVADGTTYKRSTASFTTALNTKLNGIETGATADQTAAEIKTAYESNANTNVFNDTYKSKLDAIEANATADQTASEIKIAYESNLDTNAFTDTYKSKVDAIEANATADQTAAEILTAIKTVDGTGSGLDADLLDGRNSATAATINTIALRDASGNLTAASILAANASISHASDIRTADTIFYSSTDNYIKKTDGTSFKTSLGLEQVTNLPAATGNSGNTIVQRDANGDFNVNEITGNISTATALKTSRSISLSGDVSGTVDFDGTANASITTTVADNSHNHLWANISDKPTEFEPVAISVKAMVGQMVTGNTETGLSVTYQAIDNTLDFVLTADPVITLAGDLTGSATMTNLGSTTLTATVVDDSHNHTFATLPTIDEDTMVSDSAVLLPSQQSVKAYVDTKVANVVNSAPAALDTLNELAAALGDDPNFATTLTTSLGTKADNTITITAGSGLTGGGTLAANRTISHADTSAQASVNNSGRTYIQDITLDTYGHITAISSATETVVDTDTWRGIDDIPVNGETSKSITSNWAYDHNANNSAHGATSNPDPNTIVLRNSNGDISAVNVYSTVLRTSYATAARTADTIFYSSVDDVIRKTDATSFKTSLGLDNVSNVAAASTNTSNTVVQRDASGNFSASVITANLTGNSTTATRLATARTINGVSFNGTANITLPNATTSVDGTMSSTDKTKLDGLTASAYVHPTQTAINVNLADDGISVIDNISVNTEGHVTDIGTRYLSPATPWSAGVMSTADKAKLDGMVGSSWNVISSNTNAQKGQGYSVDTSAGEVIITLPGSIASGDKIEIFDYAGTFGVNKCIIDRNNQKIMGIEEDFDCDISNLSLQLVWIDFDQGWKITAITYGGETSNNYFRKNAIINGNFDIWHRGTTQTNNGYGSDDRWSNWNAGSTKVASRGDFYPGETFGIPNNPSFFSRTVVTSVAGAGNYVIKAQKIEGVRTFAGQTVTISFWAKADSNKNMSIGASQYFGAGGSSEVGPLGVIKLALTSSWQKIVHTFSLPSISGKTLSGLYDDCLIIKFYFDAGSNYNSITDSLGQQSGTFDIAQVQLEEGSVATPFEMRLPGEELALCQRYYNQGAGHTASFCYSTGNWITAFQTFCTTMRNIPAMTVVYTGGTPTGTWTPQPKIDGWRSVITATGTKGDNSFVDGSWTADAEL